MKKLYLVNMVSGETVAFTMEEIIAAIQNRWKSVFYKSEAKQVLGQPAIDILEKCMTNQAEARDIASIIQDWRRSKGRSV